MRIRTATPQDWPQVYAIFTAVTADGTTYAYPARPRRARRDRELHGR